MQYLYKTKVIVEIECDIYGTAQDAINMIKSSLNYPAINSVNVISAKSNFKLHDEPLNSLKDVKVI